MSIVASSPGMSLMDCALMMVFRPIRLCPRSGVWSKRAYVRLVLRAMLIAIAMQLILASDLHAAAQDSPNSSAPPRRRPAAARRISAEQEQAVREFVRQHQPQLAEVLAHLESSRPFEYQRAVRDLNRHRERLAQWRSRDPQRYELELKLWKLESRAHLLAARISMADQQQLEQQLREVLAEQVETRLEIHRRDYDRLLQRKGRLEKQIELLEGRREEIVERQMKQYLRIPEDTPSASETETSGVQNVRDD